MLIAAQLVVLCLLLLFAGLVARNLRDYAPVNPSAAGASDGGSLFILVPARNESENIAQCLTGLLGQSHPAFTILVLDDASEDDTAAIVEEMAHTDSRLRLLRGEPIEPGWAGKVWACSQLAEAALEGGADWLLFLDADTRANPELAASLVGHAAETGAGMVSGFPYQITGTLSERVVLPMLPFLITTFLPVRMVWESPFPNLVAACGQVELFAAAAYRQIGGHASIPHSFHDGLQLARRAKASGITVRLCDVSRLISCRMYRGLGEVWNGFTRNAYEGLGGIGTLVTMSVLQVGLFLMPFLFLLVGIVRVFTVGRWEPWATVCAAQVGVILGIRAAQARRFGHLDSILLHPLSIVALTAIQWASFWKAKSGSAVAWKGRAYGVELKADQERS